MVTIKRSAKKRISKPVSKTTVKKTSSGFNKAKKTTSFDRKKAGLRSKGGSTGFAGARGFDQARTEKKMADENRKRRNLPWRVWIRPGEEADFILLDEQPFFMYEHDLGKDASGNKVYERCIKETGHCPLCSKTNREGYYVMMLTVLDKRGYTPKPGAKNAKPQKVVKRLMPVKQSQIPKFERMYKGNGGSFRGIQTHNVRDGEKDSVIGNDIELTKVLSDTALAKYGEELTTPVNYEEAFPMRSEEELKKMYGVSGPAGSRDFDDDDDDDDENGDGWDD